MPRLLGVDIPGRKQIHFALQYIHGIGPARAAQVLQETKINPTKKADDLTPDDLRDLINSIQAKYRVEGDLRREVAQHIRRLISIGSYRLISKMEQLRVKFL